LINLQEFDELNGRLLTRTWLVGAGWLPEHGWPDRIWTGPGTDWFVTRTGLARLSIGLLKQAGHQTWLIMEGLLCGGLGIGFTGTGCLPELG
jgi:hypothetical protein